MIEQTFVRWTLMTLCISMRIIIIIFVLMNGMTRRRHPHPHYMWKVEMIMMMQQMGRFVGPWSRNIETHDTPQLVLTKQNT
jgi:hypothetical protein